MQLEEATLPTKNQMILYIIWKKKLQDWEGYKDIYNKEQEDPACYDEDDIVSLKELYNTTKMKKKPG